jgi:hypothetical protein
LRIRADFLNNQKSLPEDMKLEIMLRGIAAFEKEMKDLGIPCKVYTQITYVPPEKKE